MVCSFCSTFSPLFFYLQICSICLNSFLTCLYNFFNCFQLFPICFNFSPIFSKKISTFEVVNAKGPYLIQARPYSGPTCTWVQQLKATKTLFIKTLIKNLIFEHDCILFLICKVPGQIFTL